MNKKIYSTTEWVTKYRRTPKGVLTNMSQKQKARSKARSFPPPAYTLQEFHDLWLDDKRFLRLFDEWSRSNYQTQLLPTVDRIDCKKPYTVENTHILTWAENHYKQLMEYRNRTGPVEQLLGDKVVGRYMSQRHASANTGIHDGDISRVVNGKARTAGGYKWRYAKPMSKDA